MLELKVGQVEMFDNDKNQFVKQGGRVLRFEHSLVSVSKWESKYEVPFIDNKDKTYEQTLYYVECMHLDGEIPDELFSEVLTDHLDTISEYINAKMTATTVNKTTTPRGQARSTGEFVTSELIYYWMIALKVPMECQHWHLNRLLKLIEVVNAKQEKPKKVPRAQAMSQQRALNAARRAQMGTTG